MTEHVLTPEECRALAESISTRHLTPEELFKRIDDAKATAENLVTITLHDMEVSFEDGFPIVPSKHAYFSTLITKEQAKAIVAAITSDKKRLLNNAIN